MIAAILKVFIRFYQVFVSPITPAACRHLPTCSEYCLESLQTHKLPKAIYLSISRILRCNPWGSSGFDPVPTNHKSKK